MIRKTVVPPDLAARDSFLRCHVKRNVFGHDNKKKKRVPRYAIRSFRVIRYALHVSKKRTNIKRYVTDTRDTFGNIIIIFFFNRNRRRLLRFRNISRKDG